MPALRCLGLVVTLVLFGACSRETELQCPGGSSYRTAQSAETLRIPDELSVPDESDSFRIPAAASAPAGSPASVTSCLEESPAFAAPVQP